MLFLRKNNIKPKDLNDLIDDIIVINSKKIASTKSDNIEDIRFRLTKVINMISNYHIMQFKTMLYKENCFAGHVLEYNESEIIDFMDCNVLKLLDIFDINGISNEIFQVLTKEEYRVFDNDIEFRINMMKASMYKILDNDSIDYRVEQALVFSKTFNLNMENILKYGTSLIKDENLDKIISKYAQNGGNIDILFYPNYFTKQDNRFSVDELREFIEEHKAYTKYIKQEKR